MKPSTPTDTEMVFLRDVEDRLKAIQNAAICGRTNLPGVLGLQSVVQCRISEVVKLRDEGETTHANTQSE